MLTANDFNKEVDHYAEKILIPLGFKKSGLHYFKISDNQFYGFIKDTYKGMFQDYYLVYSHECAGENFKNLLKKPSLMLKDYLVSVSISDLKIIYNLVEKLIDSPYYFYSLARQFKINDKCIETEKAYADYIVKQIDRNKKIYVDREFVNNYIKEIFEIMKMYGFRFYDECDMNLCYSSIQKPIVKKKMKVYMKYYQTQMENIGKYFKENNLEIPKIKTHQNWLKRIFNT